MEAGMGFLRNLFSSRKSASAPVVPLKTKETSAAEVVRDCLVRDAVTRFSNEGSAVKVAGEWAEPHLAALRYLVECGGFDREKLDGYLSLPVNDVMPPDKKAYVRNIVPTLSPRLAGGQVEDGYEQTRPDLFEVHLEQVRCVLALLQDKRLPPDPARLDLLGRIHKEFEANIEKMERETKARR